MKTSPDSPPAEIVVPRPQQTGTWGLSGEPGQEPRSASHGIRRFLLMLGLLTMGYGVVLVPMFRYALKEDLHSHVVLIPLVVAWMVNLQKPHWPSRSGSSPVGALLWGLIGLGLLGGAVTAGRGTFSLNDWYSTLTASYVALVLALGFGCLGSGWMRVLAFPAGFLWFMVPLPDAVVNGLEHFLMAASAEAVDVFFLLANLPYIRDDQVFQLPGIILRVAQECSGIRSSWVLLITSVLASWLFLRTPWKRAVLVALVIPLGILRNGFRVLVLGLLCVHKGPHMIDSDLHHRGGWVFFLLSLIPFFLLLWWLRKTERSPAASSGVVPPAVLQN